MSNHIDNEYIYTVYIYTVCIYIYRTAVYIHAYLPMHTDIVYGAAIDKLSLPRGRSSKRSYPV